jgi:hypothetical protein
MARVNHGAGEYGRGRVHTNTVEGSFSIFKRGMKGVYQHCSEKHLHRYVAEFEFRYNNRDNRRRSQRPEPAAQTPPERSSACLLWTRRRSCLVCASGP